MKTTVKVTLVQALRLCTGRTAHRGSRGIALPFHDHGTRRGWGVSVTPLPLFTPEKTRHPLYRRLGGPQDRSGQVRKISPPTGIRSPDRPARSQSLYRLSYTAHSFNSSKPQITGTTTFRQATAHMTDSHPSVWSMEGFRSIIYEIRTTFVSMYPCLRVCVVCTLHISTYVYM